MTTPNLDRPLELEPVDLPPPTGSAAPQARSLASRALLSLLLLAGVFVVAALVIAVLIGVNLAIYWAGRVVPALLVITVLVVVALARGVVAAVRRPSDPPEEVEVSEAEEPELFDEVRHLAGVAGTRPPDRIVVVHEVNAYVHEFGPLLGLLRGRRTLGIGTPLLDGLDISQLRSVLAHELGHLAGGDTRLAPIVYRTDQVLVRLVDSLQGSWTAHVFAWYWRLQHRVNARVRRGQELRADQASVQVAGRRSAAEALRAVAVMGHADEYLNANYLGPMLQAGYRPTDIPAGLRAVLSESEFIGDVVDAVDNDPSPVDPLDSHPPTPERIRRVAAMADQATVVTDHRVARRLLRDPDRWIDAAAERWLSLVVGARDLQALPWTAWADVVTAPRQRELADAVDGALAGLGLPAGLAGMRAALQTGRERDLAAALVSAGWRSGTTGEREKLLRAALASAMARDLTGAGTHRWVTSFTASAALAGPDGRLVRLDTLSAAALDGRWEELDTLATSASASGRPTGMDRPAPVSPAAHQQVPSSSQAIPKAPQPPFAPDDGLYRWQVELPNFPGRSTTWRIGDRGVALDGAHVDYADIAHVRFKIRIDSSLGSRRSATVRPILTCSTGAEVQAQARNAGSAAQADDVFAAFSYLWDVFGFTVGPRARAAIGDQLSAGQQVEVAGVRMGPDGLQVSKRDVCAWAAVEDSTIEGLQLVIRAGKRMVRVPLTAEDAYLLSALIPALRIRFG